MSRNDNLKKAKVAKNDEFYTDINDIIMELAQHKDYVRQFQGKTVLCNCDDPESSAFVEFFRKFYTKFGLRKMMATHYNKDGSPSYKLEWEGEKLKGDTINLISTPLEGNGDFRSPECIELLKEADIVVTNPPFSLFREYVALLEKYQKQYVIWGNQNAITYKEIFPLLRDEKMSIGYMSNRTCYFQIPDSYEKWDEKYTNKKDDGHKYAKVPSITVFTNLDLKKRHEPLTLTKNYHSNETRYPHYDNYDAIECGKVEFIPKDYDGVIGVPITYMAHHCPTQFEIIGGTANGQVPDTYKIGDFKTWNNPFIGERKVYQRILIRRIPGSPD